MHSPRKRFDIPLPCGAQHDAYGSLPNVHGPWKDDDPREVERRAKTRAKIDEWRRHEAKREAARGQEAARPSAQQQQARRNIDRAEEARQHARSAGATEPRWHREARPPPRSEEETRAVAADEEMATRAAMVQTQEAIALLNFRKVSAENGNELDAAKAEIALLKAQVATLEAKLPAD